VQRALKERESGLVVTALLLITLAGLTLRLLAAQQSLFGDELWTYPIVTEPNIGGVIDGVLLTENTPPLFYLLSWAAAMVGEPTTWIRLPSVLFGAAAVPMIYALTNRVAGRFAGLVAAMLMALAPFAIFYGSEARAYASLLFLLPLSTFSLLSALDGGKGRWWVLFWAAATAAVYSHYTAVFVLAVQVLWALWRYRDRWVQIGLACLAVALAYIPWIPHLGKNPNMFIPERFAQIGFEPVGRALLGHPYESIREVPGELALIALAGATCIVIAGLVLALRQRKPAARKRWLRKVSAGGTEGAPGLVLFVPLLLATPVGLALSTELGEAIFKARNLTACLPYLFLLAGVLISLIRAPFAIAAAGLATAAFALGAAGVISDENRRSPLRQAAEVVESRAEPGEPILHASNAPLLGASENPMFPTVEQHPLFQDLAIYLPDRGVELDIRSSHAWNSGARVFLVAPSVPTVNNALAEISGRAGATLTDRIVLPGRIPIAVSIYESGPGSR
jgi:4-amino-4-deoxy-L-arabinose transferase-like glycosyltransferase